MKIGEISKNSCQFRRQFWQTLPQTQAIEWIDCSFDETVENIKKLEKDVVAFFVDEAGSDKLISHYPRLSPDVLNMQLMDSIFFEHEYWWPVLFLREVLHDVIADRCSELDTHSIGYVVGTNSRARVAVDALSQFGFNRINLVETEEGQADGFVKFISRLYFGLEIKVLKMSDLILEPNNGTALINCTYPNEIKNLIEDLSYLNFMKRPGMVMDMNLLPLSHVLMDEAQHVGITTISGHEIQGRSDWARLKRLMPKMDIPQAEYLQKWAEFLSSHAHDSN